MAVFPGVRVIVPPFFTLYNGVKRFQSAQQATLSNSTLNGWIVLVLIVASFFVGVTALIIPGYPGRAKQDLGNPPEAGHRSRRSTSPADADLDRLGKLAELKDRGAITAEEFEAEKARLFPPAQGSTTEEG